MNMREASDQIDAIWAVLARNETFRGYRPATVAVTGILGVLAAAMQAWVIADPFEQRIAYTLWWGGTAALAVLIVACELALDAQRPDSGLRRRLMWKAIGQFLPAILVGAGITTSSLMVNSPSTELLPGLWALCFCLGIVASRPYLDAAIVWSAIHYAVFGVLGMLLARTELSISPWYMGCTFGLGQFLTALILYRSGGRDAQESAG